MRPSDGQRPQRSGRIVGLIAVLAILGLVLAVAIASCAGGDAGASEATGAQAAATSAEAEPAPEEPAPAQTDVEAGPAGPGRPATIVEAAAEAGTFGTLLGLLGRSTLDATLGRDGPFTLLAPTDEAFEALPDGVLRALERDQAALKQLLTYHVVPEALTPVVVAGSLTTLEGSSVEISERAGRQYAADAPIQPPPVSAGNGWLYPIGLVLLPPDMDLAGIVGNEVAAATYDRADYVVFFDSGSAQLGGAAAQTIAEAAAAIDALPDGARVRLVGVADASGDAAANLVLSRERARAVQAALQQAAPEAGVRYLVRAKGEEERPELANARRVDVTLIE